MPSLPASHVPSSIFVSPITEGIPERVIPVETARKNLVVLQALKQDQKLITDVALGILTAETPKSEEYRVVVWFGIRSFKRAFNGFKKDEGVKVVRGSFKAVDALLAARDQDVINLFQGALVGLNRLIATYNSECKEELSQQLQGVYNQFASLQLAKEVEEAALPLPSVAIVAPPPPPALPSSSSPLRMPVVNGSLGQALSAAATSLRPTVTQENACKQLYRSLSLRVTRRKRPDMAIFYALENKGKKTVEPDASAPEAFLLTRALQGGSFRLAVEKSGSTQPSNELDDSDFEFVNPALSPRGSRAPLGRAVSAYIPRPQPAAVESKIPPKDPETLRKESEARQAAERAQREALKAQSTLLAYAMQQRNLRMNGRVK